jgi:leucyl/phenylalanyl-tRNA---protein transferase
MIPWLGSLPHFPPVSAALNEPNGLLAAGGQLRPDWLLKAYAQGIFPWYNDDEPILWWSPDPRMVVVPGEHRISRSLARTLKSGRFEIRCDTAFAEVMAGCAAPRGGQAGTWIHPEMQAAYFLLYEQGWAHSVETWLDGRLVGGLYGLAIGRAFFGESMFHRVTDASKLAFVHLAQKLAAEAYVVIDCQMSTQHLASLGGREVSRAQFVQWLEGAIPPTVQPCRWPSDFLQCAWRA